MGVNVLRMGVGLFVAAIFCLTGCGGSSAPPATITANTAMFIGKSFAVDNEVITFNFDGSLSSAGTDTGKETWTISPSGQLIIYDTKKGTATFTFTGGDADTGLAGMREYANGDSGTVALVPVPGAMPGLGAKSVNISIINSSDALQYVQYASLVGGQWAKDPPAPGSSIGAGQMLGLNNYGNSPFESLGGSISLSPVSGGRIVINWSWPHGSAVSGSVTAASLNDLAVSFQILNQQSMNPTLQVMITTSFIIRE